MPLANSADRKATEVDQTIGAALKRHRRYYGYTQAELGERVGKSYKQIRKYEYGETRISASMLHMLATALEIEVADLFADLPQHDRGLVQSLDDTVRTMAENYAAIGNVRQRRAFLAMVREYADSDQNV